MRTIRRPEVPVEPLPGRGIRRFVGRNSAFDSEEMTVGTALYADEFGPMDPHHHAEETVYILDADRAWVRWGPAADDMPNRIDLKAEVVINTPSLEWHVFEWEPGGHVELLFIYGQVDNIRPEDMESER